jgi:DHA2 family multidrug resistance protein
MLTLVRNIGSSIGISMVIAQLTSTTTLMHARLGEHITPFNNALQQAGAMLSTATDQGRALLELMVTQQATIIAYDNTFKLLMVMTLIALPLVLVIGSSHAKKAPGPTEVHAMD